MDEFLDDIPFIRLGHSPDLDPDVAYSIERLMDVVRSDFDDDEEITFDIDDAVVTYGNQPNDPVEVTVDYTSPRDDLIDARRSLDYKPRVNVEKLEIAWSLLKEKKWISLQNTNAEKKLTTVASVANLPSAEALILDGNSIRDISAVGTLKRLRRLSLDDNAVTDLTPILGCLELRELSISKNPVKSLELLSTLTHLEKLTLDTGQATLLGKCEQIAALKHLFIYGDTEIPSFENFPALQELRTLRVKSIASLQGIDRFPKLLNLDASGHFNDLTALGKLTHLTHVELVTDKPLDVGSLAGMMPLRSLRLASAQTTGWSKLQALPALREVEVDQNQTRDKTLCALRASLSSWDAEFLAKPARHAPNPELQIVEQAEFDYYNGGHNFGTQSDEFNERLISSERGWLIDRINESLGIDLDEGEDFDFQWLVGMNRSDSLCISSVKAYDSFSEIVRRVQILLGECKNDWIIYFQSDLWLGNEETPPRPDFVAWIYPWKIQTTAQFAPTLERLLSKH